MRRIWWPGERGKHVRMGERTEGRERRLVEQMWAIMIGRVEISRYPGSHSFRDLLRFFFGTEMEAFYLNRAKGAASHAMEEDDVTTPSLAAKAVGLRGVVEEKKRKREVKRREQEQGIVDYKAEMLPVLTRELEVFERLKKKE